MFKGNSRLHQGFTLMELIVSIVIIGILVGLVTISFNSVTDKTKKKDLENALIDSAAAIKSYTLKNNKMPSTLSDAGVKERDGITLTYTPWGSPYFCLEGESSSLKLYIGGGKDTIQTDGCASVADIQAINSGSCPSDGRIRVRDARDNGTYWVRTLADNNCWMLTNLAYAGGVSNGGNNSYGDVKAIANGGATPAGSYTSALYYIHPNDSNPTYEPQNPKIPADGGAAAAGRQFGYYYNWCAAMGAQLGTAACSNSLTPAASESISICPSGWRLPTVDELESLNAHPGINNGSTTSSAGLVTNAFMQKTGYRNSSTGAFGEQGTGAYYWSSTPSSAANSRYMYMGNSLVTIATFIKNAGGSVRCIAN